MRRRTACTSLCVHLLVLRDAGKMPGQADNFLASAGSRVISSTSERDVITRRVFSRAPCNDNARVTHRFGQISRMQKMRLTLLLRLAVAAAASPTLNVTLSRVTSGQSTSRSVRRPPAYSGAAPPPPPPPPPPNPFRATPSSRGESSYARRERLSRQMDL